MVQIDRLQSDADGRRRSAGGVLVAVGERYTINNRSTSSQNSVEAVCLNLYSAAKEHIPFNLLTFYKSPTVPNQTFLTTVNSKLDHFKCSHVPTIVVGDFNEDASAPKPGDIVDFFTYKGFKQLVTNATRDSGSILDHVYVNFNMSGVHVIVLDAYFSDHDVVLLSVPLSKMT